MFCHVCGGKLVSGARFCSRCGTLVPQEILEEMNAQAAQAPAPEPAPVAKPAPEPAPVVKPEPKPEPAPVVKPEPKPEPAPVVKPAPEPEPAPVVKPAPEPAPEPEPEAVVIELPEEKILLDLTVTQAQLDGRETVMLEHDALEAPMKFPLRPEMKDGMRLRLTNAKLKPSPTGAKRSLLLALHVEAPEPAAEDYIVRVTVSAAQVKAEEWVEVNDSALVEPTRVRLRFNMKDGSKLRLSNVKLWPAPSGAKRTLVVQIHVTQSAAQPTVTRAPASQPTVTRAPAAEPVRNTTPQRKTVSFAPISFRCGLQFCAEDKLKNGISGDDEGSIDFSPSDLAVYRKSKMVRIGFGAIGSAIEGKGKMVAVIRPTNILSFEKKEIKRNFTAYYIHLRDGQVLKANAVGSDRASFMNVMDQFLSQV